MHEASLHPQNCFVTLTYRRDALPPNSSLEHRDFQLFMKRLRKHFKEPVRFYMCGEYGPENLRPHYHACLFNCNFDDRDLAGKSGSGLAFFDSGLLSRLWGHGRVSVQDLTKETASYCARYIMKKQLGRESEKHYESINEDGEIIKRRPEYASMSLKPGIGARWFEKYRRDVFPHDFVIQGGVKRSPPKFYDKLLKRAKSDDLDAIEFARQQRGKAAAPDNTDARRVVRETVHLARVKNLTRNDL